MIEEIRITGLGIIDGSVLELDAGLTVITGETGAGKTMIVTALGLLLGGRSDSGAVRTGARQARVEGVVRADATTTLAAAVEEVGGEVEDEVVVLARNVSASGRSRGFVGGASVPVATLGEIAQPLVAVHGQSDQHLLLSARAQRDALDRFGGPKLAKLARHYQQTYAELEATEKELNDVVSSARERAREADLLRFGVEEIEAVSPQPDEDVDLAAEESRLGFSDSLRSAAEQAREALSSDAGGQDAISIVSASRGMLDAVRDYDADVAGLADRLAEVGYLLADVAADVSSYAARIDTDPHRLAAVSERRAALTALTRKYGETLEEVLSWADQSSRRLLDLDSTDDRIEELRSDQARLRSLLATGAAALSAAREVASVALANQVSAELTLLAMPHARLQISVGQTEVEATDVGASRGTLAVGDRNVRMGRSGIDTVDFLLAANTGSEPRPLAKGASGGELSRVMLALEVALSETSSVPTFVFDEVDAGVGGAAAVEVGRRLAQLARSAQVVVVTHLPQVAAYADRHVLVEKSSDGTVTSSGLTVLDEESRERELSRMLAGMADSDTALAHARELLDVARAPESLR